MKNKIILIFLIMLILMAIFPIFSLGVGDRTADDLLEASEGFINNRVKSGKN